MTVLAAHYFLIVRDAPGSLVWRRRAAATIESEEADQSGVVYKYCVWYLNQSGKSYYNKAGI